MYNNKTILINGVRYHKERPASCRQCYFWKNRKVGCTLGTENCYYLAESTWQSPRRRKTPVRDAAMVPASASA